MNKIFDVTVFNSKNGMDYYNFLSKHIGKPKDMHSVAVLSLVRLLVFLPEAVTNAIISPQVALPLMINHPEDLVINIVKLRLQEGV
jgi:hypothetical protein